MVGHAQSRVLGSVASQGRTVVIGILSPDEIEALLRRNRIGRLAVCTASFPYVVPVNIVYDGHVVYSSSGPGQKIDIMRSQPNVTLLVDEIESPSQWQSVIVEGVYEELSCAAERRKGMATLLAASSRLAPKGLSAEPGLILYRIVPVRKSGRFETCE